MNGKNLILTVALSILLTIAGIAYAGGGMGGSGGGMMGGQGQGMMGYGSNYSNPWGSQSRTNPTDQYEKKETERLRDEVRAKRQELSNLYRSEKPNKEMIDQKIEELSKLEAELDQRISGGY